MISVTLELSKQQLKALENEVKHLDIRFDLQHTLFHVKLPDGAITAYRSMKVVFRGETAQLYAQKYDNRKKVEPVDMAGSDEVGTGDYFGPIVVVACYVPKEDFAWLQELKIMDSKSMTDLKIRELGPILIEKLTYSQLVLDNATYNKVHKTRNLNSIKAELHHKAYEHLKNKLGFLPKLSVVDQFMPKESYYKSLKNDYGITNLRFETKAENKYQAVACASVIARLAFIQAIDAMSQYYGFKFPLGAGEIVDIKGRELLKKHPNLDLNQVAKTHFKNTLRIIKQKPL